MSHAELSDIHFDRLRKLVFAFTGISLSDRKRQLVASRLQRRLRALGLPGFGEYHDLVKAQGPGGPEAGEFINAITTNKTDFFRESHHFDYVAQTVVPTLLAEGENRLKIWHAGCSTGEEVFTLGMVMADLRENLDFDYRQLATDIDTSVLAHASDGIYAEERLTPVPKAMLRKHFRRGKGEREGSYRVSSALRAPVTFRQLNLIANSWPMKSSTRFHMIFCRNVLIYFDRPTQNRLVERFHERLYPGGFLFLGHSESIHGPLSIFRSIGKTIFQALPSEREVLSEAA